MTANLPALPPIAEIERMATIVAKSGLFGVKTMEQAAALMLIAHAEGLHPAIAARDYHVISGRPALRADAMLARFQAAGGRVEWTCHTDQKVAARFSHPAGGTLEIDWTIERAKAAGLGGRDQWKAYPRQMLRARVISEGVRAIAPGVVSGIYAPEEVADMTPLPEQAPAMIVEPAKQPASLDKMIAAFAALGLTDADMAQHLGRAELGEVDPEEVEKLREWYQVKKAEV